MEKATFEYVTYISAAPEDVWKAIIDPGMTAKYWQHINVSDWKPGSPWEHRRYEIDGALDLVGKVIEFTPPRRLVLSWAFPGDKDREEKHSRLTLEFTPFRGVVRLDVIHDRLEPGSDMLESITAGWPKVIASLKSFLETGKALPELWDMEDPHVKRGAAHPEMKGEAA